jgi:hypothetical protein
MPLVQVKIITVKRQSEYTGRCSEIFPNTTVERIDNQERIILQNDCWGNAGDVFAIKEKNLHW